MEIKKKKKMKGGRRGREGEMETETTNKSISTRQYSRNRPGALAILTAHGYLILFPSILSVFPEFPTVSSPFFPWVDTLQTQMEFPKA